MPTPSLEPCYPIDGVVNRSAAEARAQLDQGNWLNVTFADTLRAAARVLPMDWRWSIRLMAKRSVPTSFCNPAEAVPLIPRVANSCAAREIVVVVRIRLNRVASISHVSINERLTHR